jgi:hypothetical protein
MNSFFENSVYRLGDARLEGDYRYYLRGEIVGAKSDNEIVVVQLNPSKANSNRSDATAGKVCNWAARNNYAVVHFLNLFARIATIQTEISRQISYKQIVGEKNDSQLIEILKSAPKNTPVVFGYGEPDGVLCLHHSKRVLEVETLLKQRGVEKIFRVGPLSNGKFPRHGRAWNKNVQLETLDFHAAAKN